MHRWIMSFLLPALPLTAFGGAHVEIIAHRGASYDAPENTVAAIKLAWEQKADASEFDVFLSKDGKIVVIHDKDTKRVAGVDNLVVAQIYPSLNRLDRRFWGRDTGF